MCSWVSSRVWRGNRDALGGGASDNRLYFQTYVEFTRKLNEEDLMLLFDPQTSGGLLLAVTKDRIDGLLARAVEANQPAWVIGEVVEGDEIEIV